MGVFAFTCTDGAVDKAETTVMAICVKADAIVSTLSVLFLVFFVGFCSPQIGPRGGSSLLWCLPTSNASAHSLYCILVKRLPCFSPSSFANKSTLLTLLSKALGNFSLCLGFLAGGSSSESESMQTIGLAVDLGERVHHTTNSCLSHVPALVQS